MADLNIITNYLDTEYIENIIKKASENNAVIICQSNTVVDEICALAKSMKLHIPEPVPIQWFKSYETIFIANQTPIILYKPMTIIQQLMNRNGEISKLEKGRSDKSGNRFYTLKKQK